MSDRPLNWQNLLQNKCPDCNGDLVRTATFANGGIGCKCGFYIKQQKYQEICAERTYRHIERDHAED